MSLYVIRVDTWHSWGIQTETLGIPKFVNSEILVQAFLLRVTHFLTTNSYQINLSFKLRNLDYSNLDRGEGNGTPLQYCCLENPMDGGAWWAAVHGVTKSQTQLSDFTFTFHFHALEKEMAPHSSTLAWKIPRMEEPGGLPSMGSHRVEHNWSDLAAAAAAAAILTVAGTFFWTVSWIQFPGFHMELMTSDLSYLLKSLMNRYCTELFS